MHIGIIVFSNTGNTQSVALLVKDKLSKDGHRVVLEEIKIEGSVQQGPAGITLTAIPDPAAYEALVICSPVQAFSLSPVMKMYLSGIKSLEHKEIAFLVTEFFPYRWMGGNRALGILEKRCASLGARVLGGEVVNWSRRNRQEIITGVVERLAGYFLRQNADETRSVSRSSRSISAPRESL